MFKPEFIRRVLRFGAVGGLVMLVFMGLNWWLEPALGRNGAFLVAYPPAVALHFCLNKWWTFACERRDAGRQVGEYLVMVGVTFLIQAGVFQALIHLTALPSWLAAGLANVAQMAITFGVMQWRIFAAAGNNH